MKELYRAEFQIVPVAQGRPRMCRVGNGVRAVDPQKSREYKDTIRLMASHDEPITDIPLEVDMTFILPTPESWSKKKKSKALAGQILPQGRPDLDNYVKAILDALNGIVWSDDSLIVSLTALKVYGETPMVRVIVTEHEIPIY